MKKLVLLVVLASIFPVSAYALGSFIPFGGRVTAVHVPPNVGCWTDLTASPFTILPAGLAPVAPWSKMYGLVNVGLVAPGAWIIGLYRPSSDGCVQVNGPEANPFPTFQTDFYGTSIPKPIPIPGV